MESHKFVNFNTVLFKCEAVNSNVTPGTKGWQLAFREWDELSIPIHFSEYQMMGNCPQWTFTRRWHIQTPSMTRATKRTTTPLYKYSLTRFRMTMNQNGYWDLMEKRLVSGQHKLGIFRISVRTWLSSDFSYSSYFSSTSHSTRYLLFVLMRMNCVSSRSISICIQLHGN